jgi:hypothetical protein
VGKGKGRKLFFAAPEGSAYLAAGRVVSDVPGLAAITADLVLVRGIELTGQITDKLTGRPVPGAFVTYTPLAGNRHIDKLPGKEFFKLSHIGGKTDDRGRYRLVIPPGYALLTAQGETAGRARTTYTQVYLDPKDRPRSSLGELDRLGETFAGYRGEIVFLQNQAAYRLIEPADDVRKLTVDFQFDPGKTLAGQVVGPDEKPLGGVTAYGLYPTRDEPVALKDAQFTAFGLDPDHPRKVVFVHPDRKLSGLVEARGDEKGLLKVKLQPWAAVTGRVVGPDGQPLREATVHLTVRKPGQVFSPLSAPANENEVVKADEDGKFRMDVRIPGVAFDLYVSHKGQRVRGGPSVSRVAVAADTTKELGDIRVRVEEP